MDNNRLLIYVFHDEEGVVDKYVTFLLTSMRRICREICFIVNGGLTPESRSSVEPHVDRLILRENIGMDAAAYRYAIREYGYENLSQYDEVICTGHSFFGPFYPIEEMFQSMGERKCDWWSIYQYPASHNDNGTPFLYPHIPGRFVVYRNSILRNQAFRRYWESLPPTDTLEYLVLNHEQRQTPFYDRLGFVKSLYIDYMDLSNVQHTDFPQRYADILLQKGRMPLLPREVFFPKNGIYPYAKAIMHAIQLIKKNTSYPVQFITDNLRRTTKSTLHLRNTPSKRCYSAIFCITQENA